MSEAIVFSAEPVILLGGGPVQAVDLALAERVAQRFVAADGGLDRALMLGRRPEAVIGDLDSATPQARAEMDPAALHEIHEQDSTDFDKALRHIEAPLVVGLGFLGARLDHQLAALNTLVRRPERLCVLIGPEEVVLHLPPRLELPLEAGDVVSLFAMTPVEGRSAGLHWPIDGLVMAPDAQIGTSNRATGPVTLEMAGAGMLAMVPRGRFERLCRALLALGPGLGTGGQWPARAG